MKRSSQRCASETRATFTGCALMRSQWMSVGVRTPERSCFICWKREISRSKRSSGGMGGPMSMWIRSMTLRKPMPSASTPSTMSWGSSRRKRSKVFSTESAQRKECLMKVSRYSMHLLSVLSTSSETSASRHCIWKCSLISFR